MTSFGFLVLFLGFLMWLLEYLISVYPSLLDDLFDAPSAFVMLFGVGIAAFSLVHQLVKRFTSV